MKNTNYRYNLYIDFYKNLLNLSLVSNPTSCNNDESKLNIKFLIIILLTISISKICIFYFK